MCCLWRIYGRGADELQYYVTKRGIIFGPYLVEDKTILTLSVTVQSGVYSPLEHTLCTTMSDTLTFSYISYGSPNKELFLLYTALSYWLL